MKKFNTIFIIAFALLLTACGEQGFDAVEANKQIIKNEVDLGDIQDEADKTLEEVSDLVDEVENSTVLDDIENGTGLSLTKLLNIKKLFKEGLKPLIAQLGDVGKALTEIQIKVEAQIALMDPNDPAQAAATQKLTKMLDKLNYLQDLLDDQIENIVSKVDLIDGLFDKLMAKIEGHWWSIPLKLLLAELKDYVKDQIKEALRDLLAGRALAPTYSE